MKYHKLYETWKKFGQEETPKKKLNEAFEISETAITAENVGDLENFLGTDLSAIGEEAISKIKDKVLGWVDEYAKAVAADRRGYLDRLPDDEIDQSEMAYGLPLEEENRPDEEDDEEDDVDMVDIDGEPHRYWNSKYEYQDWKASKEKKNDKI